MANPTDSIHSPPWTARVRGDVDRITGLPYFQTRSGQRIRKSDYPSAEYPCLVAQPSL